MMKDAFGSSIHLRRGVNLQVCHSRGTNPAVVFIHGVMGNRFDFRSQYEFSQSLGWQVLAYDLAGNGQSSPYKRYSIGRHCRDLGRLLDHFGISSPILCCHDFGVSIGLELAQYRPISGIIAIAGGTHNLIPWWEIPLMKLIALGGSSLYKVPAVQTLTNFFSTSYHHKLVKQFLSENSISTGFSAYKALKIFWNYDFFARYPSPKNLQVPALVITGGQDKIFTHSMGKKLASYFSNSIHLHINQAGHLVMIEYSDLINEAIAKWLITVQLDIKF
ncbi:alpha/beta hydrolase [Chlorogloeopsis sp. ULAP01]|uniref:alpha/beta fold hydrolase n=1 Tax=Chlorogloeopsis sp. ULAP01 TaxID=3056483 RepID=UPI0025AB356F|nr:alpha/beta hydrolase [Chlorogloeopsis sp. ULAP01]MDM9382432.1 alpha/beta hydrolase [Chlorogloeopsis sp. ULAP01]